MQTTSSPSIPAQAEQLRIALARAARRLRQKAGTDLGPTLAAALATIERHGPLTPSQLAARERIQRPTATRLVAKLLERGLITRTVDPGDARSALLAVTPAGAELLVAGRTRKDAFLAQRLDGLGADERALLAAATELLERLLQDGEPS